MSFLTHNFPSSLNVSFIKVLFLEKKKKICIDEGKWRREEEKCRGGKPITVTFEVEELRSLSSSSQSATSSFLSPAWRTKLHEPRMVRDLLLGAREKCV